MYWDVTVFTSYLMLGIPGKNSPSHSPSSAHFPPRSAGHVCGTAFYMPKQFQFRKNWKYKQHNIYIKNTFKHYKRSFFTTIKETKFRQRSSNIVLPAILFFSNIMETKPCKNRVKQTNIGNTTIKIN